MNFLPFDRMWERVEIARENSDDDYFNNLMYLGEMLTKITAAGMIAAVNDGRDRQQYRLKYQLVHSDGIGDWARVIDQILTGVPAQHLMSEAHEEAKQLTERHKEGTWQHDSVVLLDQCLKVIAPNSEQLPKKISGRHWYNIFAALRNKTRGHGAVPSGRLSAICDDLHNSLCLVADNFRLFQRGWGYLQQTLRGKYRVTRWNDSAESLNFLKTREGIPHKLADGVYVHFSDDSSTDALMIVDLVYSDIDAKDFYLPNGSFNGRRFQIISYVTGLVQEIDASLYTAPITDLPASETQGLPELAQKEWSIVNLPPVQNGYIEREPPEQKLYDEIVGDNQHRIITLIGRGGIGKTWLALKVLNQVADEQIFDAILWFSARDIDLLPDGAKQVRPHTLTESEIADEFARLIAPYMVSYDELTSEKFSKIDFLRNNMRQSELGRILFVFDNFETVKSPIELFYWIDHYLRLPNKALITTRFREFKGDYPVELRGMSIEECTELINITARDLGIAGIITQNYIDELYSLTGGHPYIVKILLGEVKKAGRSIRIDDIISNRGDMLDALFERTYSRLSTAAQRVFLTLCNWKSLIAQLAVEAVLLRPENEHMDVSQAIEDLHNSSLIEKTTSDTDEEVFLSVPLVAMQFGQRKLSVSRMKTAIQADTELLHFFGAAQETDVQRGIAPRIHWLFRNVERQVRRGNRNIDDFAPVLEFVSRKYPPAWRLWATLYERQGDLDKAEEVLKRFLEFSVDSAAKRSVWRQLAQFYSVHSRYDDELFALLELIHLSGADLDSVSYTANRFNGLMSDRLLSIDDNQKNYIVNTLIEQMESRITEADATDCSRLAWLYLQRGQTDKAIEYACRGLEMETDNEYCQNLYQKLTGGG